MPAQNKSTSFSIRAGKGGGEKRRVTSVPAMRFKPVQNPHLLQMEREGVPEEKS